MMDAPAAAAAAAEAPLRGPASITHRRVLLIAAPIVISNATVPILGAVDTAVVGQLGAAAPIGAVGLGAVIINFLYWAFGFLRMGTGGLTAQAIGAEDDEEVAALLVRGLLIAGAAGLAIVLLQTPLFALGVMVSPGSAEVEGLAHDYLAARVWGAPAAIAIYAITGWLIAAERTRAVLVVQLVMNGLNIGLDVAFVLGLDWGVEGVGVATAISEWTGAALGLWLCRNAFAGSAWKDRSLILRAERLRNMLAVNVDIMIRSVLLLVGFTAFTMKSAAEGDVALAANQILIQFLSIAAYSMDGFAHAGEALVGKALGARNRSALRRAAVISGFWCVVVGIALTAVYLIFGRHIIDAMTTAPGVREAAYAFLIWVAFAPLAGAPSWILDGVFIGATRTRDMRNAMLVAVPVYLVFLFALPPFFGNNGLWAAMLLFLALRGATMAVRYPALEAAADRPR